jgi:hypothetical protein
VSSSFITHSCCLSLFQPIAALTPEESSAAMAAG